MTTKAGKAIIDELFSALADNWSGTSRWNEQEQLRRVEALVTDVEREAAEIAAPLRPAVAALRAVLER